MLLINEANKKEYTLILVEDILYIKSGKSYRVEMIVNKVSVHKVKERKFIVFLVK